jgi:hypothetical protein
MEYPDYTNPLDDNLSIDSNNKKFLDETKESDRGYSKIYRNYETENGKIKRRKIDLYSSGDIGSQIRDAETGDYFKQRVGSLEEELFFKVKLVTGECNSSSTFFYSSPEQFMAHLNEDVPQHIINQWNQRKNIREKIVAEQRRPRGNVVVK